MTHKYPTYHLGPEFCRKLDVFVDKFTADGFEYFSDEFAQIDDFLTEVKAESPDRDAHGLRRTEKARYLLEIVSFKLLDRLNRDAFNRCQNVVIIMPDCLSLHNPDCLKEDLKTGDECQQCDTGCQSFDILDLAAEYGITAVFSKRKLSQQIEHYSSELADLGVIGIGCALMLADGMRTASGVGVPSRGVLLDCCGCEHWNEKPFASPFLLEQLKSILREKYDSHADSKTDY